MSHGFNVLLDELRFPEGPLFGLDGALWCVEADGGGLVRRAPDGGIDRVATGGGPNGLALGSDGRVWICDNQRGAVLRLDPATGTVDTMAEGFAKPNDLAFDPIGNLVFTCPGDSRREPTGAVRCLARDGRVTTVAEGFYFPNGLAFTDDGATLLIAETYRGRVWRGAWSADERAWHAPEPFCVTSGEPGLPGGPDGLAVGADGCVHVAVYGAGRIERFAADGAACDPIPVHGRNPTNCAFDPSGRLGLVVTEAEHGRCLSYPEFGRGVPLFSGPPAC